MRTQTVEQKWCRPYVAGCAGLLLVAGATAARAAQAEDAVAQVSSERELAAAIKKQLAEQADALREV
ncbi:MAG TPA: hypothetical protein VJ722_04805, partial [Rhodanobacteraceae bacterium]|nr:hypothetical protein [Rhodanobacteraceae bacterium]